MPGTLGVWRGTDCQGSRPQTPGEGLSLQGCEARGRLSSHLREPGCRAPGRPSPRQRSLTVLPVCASVTVSLRSFRACAPVLGRVLGGRQRGSILLLAEPLRQAHICTYTPPSATPACTEPSPGHTRWLCGAHTRRQLTSVLSWCGAAVPGASVRPSTAMSPRARGHGEVGMDGWLGTCRFTPSSATMSSVTSGIVPRISHL